MAEIEQKTIGAHFSAIVCESQNDLQWDHVFESARSALYALLRTLQPESVWIPYYACDAVVDAARASGVGIKRYTISPNLSPQDDVEIDADDLIILIDYYGLCSSRIREDLKRFRSEQVIVDCSQALFDRDFDCLACIYSPRKFLPVPDGGGVFFQGNLPCSPASDERSIDRYQYLLHRIAKEPEASRDAYLASELELADIKIRGMSQFTRALIASMDLEYIAHRRRENFTTLSALHECNEFSFELGTSVPLCYPFLHKRSTELRQHLISQRIFSPKYWPNTSPSSEFEQRLNKDAVFLPIDHRYVASDMRRVAMLVKEFIGSDQ